MTRPHLVQHADDLTSVRLHNDGWRVDWFANADCYHGNFVPHIAWRPDGTDSARTAPATPAAETGAASSLAPPVPPEDLVRALACKARTSTCPTPSYCPAVCATACREAAE